MSCPLSSGVCDDEWVDLLLCQMPSMDPAPNRHFMKPLHIWMDHNVVPEPCSHYMVQVWSLWISRFQAAGGMAVSLLTATGPLPGSFLSHLDQGNREGPGFSPRPAQFCTSPSPVVHQYTSPDHHLWKWNRKDSELDFFLRFRMWLEGTKS